MKQVPVYKMIAMELWRNNTAIKTSFWSEQRVGYVSSWRIKLASTHQEGLNTLLKHCQPALRSHGHSEQGSDIRRCCSNPGSLAVVGMERLLYFLKRKVSSKNSLLLFGIFSCLSEILDSALAQVPVLQHSLVFQKKGSSNDSSRSGHSNHNKSIVHFVT